MFACVIPLAAGWQNFEELKVLNLKLHIIFLHNCIPHLWVKISLDEHNYLHTLELET